MEVTVNVSEAKIEKKLAGEVILINGTKKSVQIDAITIQLFAWVIRRADECAPDFGRRFFNRSKTILRESGLSHWQAFAEDTAINKSRQRVLVSDRAVPPRSTTVVPFSEALRGLHLLPTYVGKSVQFKTKLFLEMFMNGNKRKSLWFPVQLFPPASSTRIPTLDSENMESPEEGKNPAEVIDESNEEEDGDETLEDTTGALKRTNPFLPPKKKERLLQHFPAKASKAPIFTRISDSRGEIVKLQLLSTDFHPGQSVFGVLDFRESAQAFTCTQYCVSLIAVEITPRQLSGTHAKGKNYTDHEERVPHARTSEVCIGFDTTNFELFIPENATPCFKSNLVSLYWVLRFEFVLANSEEVAPLRSASSETWKAPVHLAVRTRKWEMPIQINAE